MDVDFTMCSWTLEVDSFPGIHTDVAITRRLEEILERWELDPDMYTLMERDGASNVVLGSDILGSKYDMYCPLLSLCF